MTDPGRPDTLSPPERSDEAILHRIMARYYDHIEDLQIPDVDRRTQLALDLGYLIGFAMRSLRDAARPRLLVEPPAARQDLR